MYNRSRLWFGLWANDRCCYEVFHHGFRSRSFLAYFNFSNLPYGGIKTKFNWQICAHLGRRKAIIGAKINGKIGGINTSSDHQPNNHQVNHITAINAASETTRHPKVNIIEPVGCSASAVGDDSLVLSATSAFVLVIRFS